MGRVHKDLRNLYLYTLNVLCVYAVVTHAANVVDPLTDYFYHSDQIVFYKDAVRLSKSNASIFHESFDNLLYVEYPGFALLTGIFSETASFFGVQNLMLFLKVNTICIAAMIPVYMVRISQKMNFDFSKTDIILFIIASHFLVQSVVYTRDIYTTFMFTVFAHNWLQEYKFRRYIFMVIIASMCLFFRLEQGLVLLVLLLIKLQELTKIDVVLKVLLASLSLCLLYLSGLVGDLVELSTILFDGFDSYTRSINGNSSLVLRLKDMIFPFNILSLFFYSQFMPLPVTLYVRNDLTQLHTLFTPFLWVYMWHVNLLSIKKISMRNPLDKLFLIFLGAVLFSSFIEPNVRRSFAMYPILYLYYIKQKGTINIHNKTSYLFSSILLVVALNIFAFVYLN